MARPVSPNAGGTAGISRPGMSIRCSGIFYVQGCVRKLAASLYALHARVGVEGSPLLGCTGPHREVCCPGRAVRREGGKHMDFLTGKRETGVLDLQELLSEEKDGCVVKTNGFEHP